MALVRETPESWRQTVETIAANQVSAEGSLEAKRLACISAVASLMDYTSLRTYNRILWPHVDGRTMTANARATNFIDLARPENAEGEITKIRVWEFEGIVRPLKLGSKILECAQRKLLGRPDTYTSGVLLEENVIHPTRSIDTFDENGIRTYQRCAKPKLVSMIHAEGPADENEVNAFLVHLEGVMGDITIPGFEPLVPDEDECRWRAGESRLRVAEAPEIIAAVQPRPAL